VNTRIWIDSWLYDKLLCTIAPIIFILCEQKEVSVAKVKNGEVQLKFRRWLTDDFLLGQNLG